MNQRNVSLYVTTFPLLSHFYFIFNQDTILIQYDAITQNENAQDRYVYYNYVELQRCWIFVLISRYATSFFLNSRTLLIMNYNLHAPYVHVSFEFITTEQIRLTFCDRQLQVFRKQRTLKHVSWRDKIKKENNDDNGLTVKMVG